MKLIRPANKGIILLLILLITTSFSGFVFATGLIDVNIVGLRNSQTGIATCRYNPTTNDCVLNGTDYNIVSNLIAPVSAQEINLVINDKKFKRTNFKVSCVSEKPMHLDCFRFNDDENKVYIEFSGFNSIKISLPTTIKIEGHTNLANTQIDFSKVNNLILENRLDINISKVADLNYYYNQGWLYSYVPESNILFNKVYIKENGNLNIVNHKDYNGYAVLLEVINNDTSDQSTYTLNTSYFADIISFEQVDNNGTINLNCSTKVDNSVYNNNTCNFYFKSITGKLPNQISNANNNGNLYISTCGPLSLPNNSVDYNVCNLNYVRPARSENIINLNIQNTGVNKINIVNKTCSVGNIEEQISQYLFTSDSDIESTPIIFGTINSTITSLPLDISLNTTNDDIGLYNTKNIRRIFKISQEEDTFFKLFLPGTHILDANLLDSYLFRFMLDRNQDIGYPDINLYYPFKIHK